MSEFHSFLWQKDFLLNGYATFFFFIHFSVDKHLGCFCLLAIVHNASVITCVKGLV